MNLLRRSRPSLAAVDKVTAANIEAIDLRERRSYHADKIGQILDALYADQEREKKNEASARDRLDGALSAQIEIGELIKAYTRARADIENRESPHGCSKIPDTQG